MSHPIDHGHFRIPMDCPAIRNPPRLPICQTRAPHRPSQVVCLCFPGQPDPGHSIRVKIKHQDTVEPDCHVCDQFPAEPDVIGMRMVNGKRLPAFKVDREPMEISALNPPGTPGATCMESTIPYTSPATARSLSRSAAFPPSEIPGREAIRPICRISPSLLNHPDHPGLPPIMTATVTALDETSDAQYPNPVDSSPGNVAKFRIVAKPLRPGVGYTGLYIQRPGPKPEMPTTACRRKAA